MNYRLIQKIAAEFGIEMSRSDAHNIINALVIATILAMVVFAVYMRRLYKNEAAKNSADGLTAEQRYDKVFYDYFKVNKAEQYALANQQYLVMMDEIKTFMIDAPNYTCELGKEEYKRKCISEQPWYQYADVMNVYIEVKSTVNIDMLSRKYTVLKIIFKDRNILTCKINMNPRQFENEVFPFILQHLHLHRRKGMSKHV
jgi:hypothetical protein